MVNFITHIICSAAFSLFLFFFLSSFCNHALTYLKKKTNYDHLWRSEKEDDRNLSLINAI